MSGGAAHVVVPRRSRRCYSCRAQPPLAAAPDRPMAPAHPDTAERAVTTPLSDIAIQRELGALPGWSRRGGALTKTFTLGSFAAAIEMVRRVADAAEAADHHPDIDIRGNRLAFKLSTHAAGGVTQQDIDLAREIERLARPERGA